MLQPQSQHYSNASCMSSTPVQSQKPVHVNHSSPTRMSNRECQNNNTQPGIMHARVICNKPVRVALRERIDLELVRSLTEEPPSEVSGLPHRQRVARLIPHRGTTLRGLRVATSRWRRTITAMCELWSSLVTGLCSGERAASIRIHRLRRSSCTGHHNQQQTLLSVTRPANDISG